MAGRWVDVGEVARELGISTDAVRKRIARGSLESDRPDGNVLVWLDDGGTEARREAQVDGGPLVESLRDQVAYLREMIATRDEEIRRRDVIISQLTSRIPEIEPPREHTPSSEPPGASERIVAEPERAEPGSAAGGAQEGYERPPDTAEFPVRGKLTRPWWRRVFR